MMELLPERGCSTRIHRRYAYRVDATFQTGETVRHGVTENISAGGVFLLTAEPRPVGEIVTLLVPLPCSRRAAGPALPDGVPREVPPLWATAKVRWVRQAEGPTRGMGVEFIALDPSSRRAIRQVFEASA